MFLWIKAFHLIMIVCWFAGIFYLPRLFVYHTETTDTVGDERFKVMERKLYRGIMMPSMILTVLFGLWLLYLVPSDMSQPWMHAKLSLVALLIIYHFMCGHYVKVFAQGVNTKSHKFYRVFNEIPVFMLIGIIILVVVRPF
ncbi:protoporphyrinogen oxidase HemJ [Sansalvadorimonas sp. 2012CJ34-2]|uniref:Protoporphyrinogen IX oxidase n=1 Tax=Parendozoicomonas callyspongiae TaxID=2942213 RepID=A0ABT0PGW7_9GAMM|nr:protoporphyrinogen oxidase HemJ [Sansalvadorimonas sp. 2012CJ34-2]MCL6270501.1 protoporphyrinogen oxidase HemJ [Sansalvadorimonas sp. 2012CJ34-2]